MFRLISEINRPMCDISPLYDLAMCDIIIPVCYITMSRPL